MDEVIVRRQNNLTVLSIEVGRKDDVKFGVNPKQTIALIVCTTDTSTVKQLRLLMIMNCWCCH